MTVLAQLPELGFALAAGMVLGLAYFLILWLTLQRISSSRMPVRLMIFSYAARLSLVLPGFYLVMDHRWQRAVSALAGFIIIRAILTHTLGRQESGNRSRLWKYSGSTR